MIKTILFDLDGTLLRMDQDAFVKYYFGGLAAHMAPYGYDPNTLIKAIWEGTGAMIANKGETTNEEVFWNVLKARLGEHVTDDFSHFEEFYQKGFEKARAACGDVKDVRTLIDALHQKKIRTVLATNPIFPEIATNARIRWAGLTRSDFELITTYENSHHCKPNLDYYSDILQKLNLDPTECCMVGNDVDEDMIARELGMQVFLLTDCLLNRNGTDIAQYPHGDITALEAFLQLQLS